MKRLVLRYICTAETKQVSATSTAEKLDRARRDLARLLVPLSTAAQELRKNHGLDSRHG